MINLRLQKDIDSFLDRYFKFNCDYRAEHKFCCISGEIDVCDKKGNYWKSFDIEIYIDKETYPYCIPLVAETSKIINRNNDNHIAKDGICCLDVDHELLLITKKGIHFSKFYRDIVYPYFANFIYKTKSGSYANGEYSHGFSGVTEFYSEKLSLDDPILALKLLEELGSGTRFNRNEKCFCGSGKKLKKCHLNSVNVLKSLPKNRLEKDIIGFKNVIDQKLI